MKKILLVNLMVCLLAQLLSGEKPKNTKPFVVQLSEMNERTIAVQQLSDFITAHKAYRFATICDMDMLTADDWGRLWHENHSQLRRLHNLQKTYWFEFLRSTYKERKAYIKAHRLIDSRIRWIQDIIYSVKGSTGKTSFNEIHKIT